MRANVGGVLRPHDAEAGGENETNHRNHAMHSLDDSHIFRPQNDSRAKSTREQFHSL
jgi:hypothetical protein